MNSVRFKSDVNLTMSDFINKQSLLPIDLLDRYTAVVVDAIDLPIFLAFLEPDPESQEDSQDDKKYVE